MLLSKIYLLKTIDRNILIGFILLQLIISIPFISSHAIALDEPFSIYWANQSWGELFTMFGQENNPPLHFILLKVWIGLFGDSAISVRSLSLIFGCLTIIPLYKLGLRQNNRILAILLSFLFIANNFHHYHILEARTYPILTFAFTWMLLILNRIVHQEKFNPLELGFVYALILYTHYLGVFILFFTGIILILYVKKWIRNWTQVILSFAIGVILFIPGILLFIARLNAFNASKTWVPSPHWTEIYGNILRFFNGSLATIVLGILFIGLFIFQYGVKTKSYFHGVFSNPSFWIIPFFIINYFGLYLISIIFQPIFLDRYLLYTSILLFLSLTVFIQPLLNKYNYSVLLLIVPYLVFFNFKPENNREPDLISEFVNEKYDSTTAIIICPPTYDLTFLYHYDHDLFLNQANLESHLIFPVYNKENLPDGYENYIFVDAHAEFTLPENGIFEELNSRKSIKDQRLFKGDYKVVIFGD